MFAIDATEFSIQAFNTQTPPDFEARELYPECCEYHKNFATSVKQQAEVFPNCCDQHKKLLTRNDFKKSDYDYVENKVIDTVHYTEFHIANCISKEDWYEDITDYIEYTTSSYGQPYGGYGAPVGLNLYEGAVKNFLSSHKEFGKEKIQRLFAFLDRFKKPIPVAEKTDFGILYSIYQRWLKTFPFDIPIFRDIKPVIANSLPLLAEKPIQNRYTGLASAKLQTQEGLLKLLLGRTTELLKLIDHSHIENGSSQEETNAYRMQVIKEKHRISQLKLLETYTKGELKYVKVLKKWLENEKTFFKEITPLLKHEKIEMEQPVKDITPIDTEELYRRIPFEIAYIFLHPSPRGERYAWLKGEGYHFFTDWSLWSHFIDTVREGTIFNTDLEKITLEDLPELYPYFSAGFSKGYHGFDEKIKASTGIFQNDMQSVARKVFEVINLPAPGLPSYGMITKEGENYKVIKKKIWEESGIKAGEKYKAWYFIIHNPQYFVEMFNSHEPFRRCYRTGMEFWSKEPGGEGMHEALKLIIDRIDKTKSDSLETVPENNSDNKTIAGVALLYYFRTKFDGESIITKTNAGTKAAAFGYTAPTSGKQLLTEFNKFSQDSERLQVSRESGRAYSEHLKRYQYVLSQLTPGSESHNTAQQEWQNLSNK